MGRAGMKPVRALSFVLALTLSPVCAAAPSLQRCVPQSLDRPAPPAEGALPSSWLQPAPANPIGCAHGISFRAGDDVVLWRCQVVPADGEDLPEGHPEYAFLVMKAGAPLQVLPDDLMAGRYHGFEIVRVDLDGDGTAEHVLAAWNAQGNGLGVNRWTIRVFDAAGNAIVFCSGRTDDCRAATEVWLAEHVGVPYEALHMRATGDQRRDSIVKAEIFDREVRDKYHVVGVFDDRAQVVRMWRALGLTVFQVAEGNF